MTEFKMLKKLRTSKVVNMLGILANYLGMYNQKLIAGPFFGIFDIESPWKTYKSVEKLSLSPLLAFDDLIKKYGPVVKIYMGGQNAVLLGGKQTLCKQNL